MSLLFEVRDLPMKNNYSDKLAVIIFIVVVIIATGYMTSQVMKKPESITKPKNNDDERK